MEQPREFPLELLVGLREEMAELRATVTHMSADLAHLREDVRDLRQEVRMDIRRLDTRVFQLMLAQIATLATALGALLASLTS